MVDLWVVLVFVLIGAILYTSVGHGGATVYLAILTLAGYAIDPLITTVLVLNIAAAGIATLLFQRAGHLSLRLLWPFLVTSVPAAFVGGLIELPAVVRSQILGAALLLAALRFIIVPRAPSPLLPLHGKVFFIAAPLIGAVLGFLAGATGIGGGIFLSPLLVLLGWATVRQAAGVAGAFIVVNSLSGLFARLDRTPLDLHLLLPLLAVVVVGAIVGAYAGARRLPPRALQLLLAVVLLVAGVKALFA